MKRTIIAQTLFGLLSTLVLVGGQVSYAVAASSSLDIKELDAVAQGELLTQETQTSLNQWLPELLKQINQLPEVQAQIARQQQAELVIAAADRAVYNPELGLNYQNSETDTYTVGLSQTLDWGDKRGVATRLAQLEAQILLADIRLERSQMLAERLLALAEQAQGQKALTFAEQQLRFTQAQLNIAEQRFAAGDLSDVELQLLKLELASNTADYALAEQAALVAEGKVIELLGVDKLKFREFISDIGQFVSMIAPKAELPALTSAHQQVLLAKANAMKVKADTAADPTFNLGLEREGSDNKFGVGVAIPLQVRNNYSELQSVADKGIAIAEQSYLARERVLTAKQAQFNNALPRLLARYQDWRERVAASGSKAAKSLSEQWRSGDVSTSEYLQSRRQLAASYLVGLNLETAIYQSWLTWMGDSGQLLPFIDSLTATSPTNAVPAKSIVRSH
ncbi:TolC family protein [Shewanella xiamenensis]|uniref:TolC family protein n=1 Tax=Shewanella xiamenensis TaxID=332186 RepID=UPI0024A788B1|nr:TolC family protein [Shewanella xiamenensis]MDI5834918.1 TolC family protein [Shewanella xiamenensis]MDI5838858.1 TolC family protein [Shewanella xiamenensis]MDI5845407.1 TolC family protein [Shewanella xiamenensis]MDI5849240.1 TolC family protein [Shewanella xiamenensis]MDI5850808.1 TolC family protein [Shewanella xiamenensis]